jgi:putative DNA primase/helicase
MSPPDVIHPGKLYRFPGVGKRNGNTAGWCRLFDDGLGGVFGDWSSGMSEYWQAKRDKPILQSERVAFMRHAEKIRKRVEVLRQQQYTDTAERAVAIWDAAKSAMFHEYLKRKRVLPLGIRVDHNNNLLIPLTDGKHIQSLQFIQPDGSKRFLKDGKTKGLYYPIELTEPPEKLLICEGFATGASLYMDTKLPVLAAFNACNLKSVALAARKRWPDAELIIAGDDDRMTAGNPGVTKAKAAAIAAGALLALPQWPEDAPENLTDFNDLQLWLNRGVI